MDQVLNKWVIPTGEAVSALYSALTDSLGAQETVTVKSEAMLEALNSFKRNIGRSITAGMLNIRGELVVQVPIKDLSVESREVLKTYLDRRGWVITLQDRDFISIVPVRSQTQRETKKEEVLIYSGKLCPWCRVPTQIISASENGSGVRGNIRRCPKCFASVACHPDSNDGMGAVAPADIRRERKLTHMIVDALHKDGLISRHDLYFELARKLRLPKERCHIGCMLTMEELNNMKHAAKTLREELLKKKAGDK